MFRSSEVSKKGFQERFQLLLQHQPKLEIIYNNITITYPKSKVKPDDILDAMVLCVANLKSETSGLKFLEDENNIDDQGLFIKVAY